VETSSAKGETAASGFNFGVSYDLTDHLQLSISAGSGLARNSSIDGLNYYAGVQWTI